MLCSRAHLLEHTQNANRATHTYMPHSGGLCSLRQGQWKWYSYLHRTSGEQKRTCWDPNVIGLFTTFVPKTKLVSAKCALDIVHALLGVSHSWWASEIASFLSRWRWAGPSLLTSHSGVGLWGLCRVQQAKCGGPGSFIPPDTHSMLLRNPPLTLKAKKETWQFWKPTEHVFFPLIQNLMLRDFNILLGLLRTSQHKLSKLIYMPL